jgi:hypothetical protein
LNSIHLSSVHLNSVHSNSIHMNSIQITDLLTKYCQNFVSVVPANIIPPISTGQFLILNTDELNETGTHWVCIHKTAYSYEFFDSLANSPGYYHTYWHEFLLSDRDKYLYNCTQLQDANAQTCGQYCITYAILRSNNYTLEKIIEKMKKLDVELLVSILKSN